MKYFLERLDEPSTWRGIFILLALFFSNLSEMTPEQWQKMIEWGLGGAGVIGVFSKG